MQLLSLVFHQGSIVITNEIEHESGNVFNFDNISFLDTVQISIISNDQDEKKSEYYNLIFTGLPIIILNTSTVIMKNIKTSANFLLNNPEANQDSELYSIGLKIRGAASSHYKKKSYSIDFRKDSDWDETKNVSLLGLRNDDDWILDAVYMDRSLMRNRISHDIFLDIFNNTNNNKDDNNWTARGKFVEVFMNNQYEGVYVLSEKIDRKQLNLSDENNSYLFKANIMEQNPYRKYIIKHPKKSLVNLGFIQLIWDEFIELLDFVMNSSDDYFTDSVDDKFNIDNIINYQILLLLTSVSDNIEKNYFIAKKEEQNSDEYRHYFIPWDLDSSFGRHWYGVKYGQYSFQKTFLTERLFENPNFIINFRNRWFELREYGNVLSQESLNSRFEEYYELLYQTGAYDRNVLKWPIEDDESYPDNDNYEDDYNYIQFWLNQRLIWLDNEILSL